MGFRAGIEECDRSLVADSTLWQWIGYEKSQMEFRVGIEECDLAYVELR
jgi:hypothetical protein